MKEVFFSGGSCCLGKVTGPRKEMVVVEMVQREVLNNLAELMEVFMLVLLILRGWMWETVGRRVTERVLCWVVEEILVWGMEGLMKRIVTGSQGLPESSGKTSDTVFYSFLNSFSMRRVVGVDGMSLLK